jgi:glycosyltransferase 2 family protein
MPSLAERRAGTPGRQNASPSRTWPRIKRVLTWVFFGLVTWLLVSQARSVEWGEVWTSVQALPASALALGAGLALLSHLLYSTFDLIGRHVTGHPLRTGQVMLITFISYAFNLNLGALVGGFAFRYRLYSRLGLDNPTITRVLTMSMLTNWLGYFVLGGAVFLLQPLALPPDWKIGSAGLQWLGAALLAVAAAWLAACAFSRRRTWTVRGHEIALPSMRLASLQLLMSCTNWMLIGGAVYMLLDQRIAYPAVLSVLLIAAVAGVITHVPAGLGVLEAVFVALLSHQVPKGELLGALLAYRAVYYLGPLVLATAAYLLVEARAKALRAGA